MSHFYFKGLDILKGDYDENHLKFSCFVRIPGTYQSMKQCLWHDYEFNAKHVDGCFVCFRTTNWIVNAMDNIIK